MKRFTQLVFLFLLALPLGAQTVLKGHVKAKDNSAPATGFDVLVFLEDSLVCSTFTDSLGNFTFSFPRTYTKFRFRISTSNVPVGIMTTSFDPVPAPATGQQHCTLSVVTIPVLIDDRGGPPLTGIHSEYYPNGQLYMSGELLQNGRSGEWFSFYESGQLWSRGTYVNDVRQGYAVSYHANGKKSSEGYYKNGKMTGAWKFWDEAGTLVEKDFGN